jgi:amino acid transporter
MILDTISLMFIIYFGYFILIDSKYFLDFISTRLERRERGKARSVIYDVAAIISLILASELLTPFVESISDVGYTLMTLINIIFLAIGFFIVYHLANEIYYLVKKDVEKLVEETSRQIRKEHKEKTNKGEAK